MTPDDRTRTHAPARPDPDTGTFDPALDAGLAAAFGADPTPGGWSQPPLLRDDPSEHAPLVQPGSPEVPRGAGDIRYQLLGEIARGGMGVVIKGRDPDLGRDLAFKVLRTELANKPAAVQRFVEEAQVGGQLQHPGVVPVYDLGRFADGRPYFAMKLVKGRTLADLLTERPDSSAERGRFLQSFLQVCQTIAYAHAKGVIHRDLKPSNVMVGAFGEVLVMDWGLAKVLPRGGVADELKAQSRAPSAAPEEPTVIKTARAGSGGGSETQAGSVMGTPAFMPPEQAGGEIDKLDERADVFGLGAVLCVILTGQPPYVADTGEAIRLMAVRGDLEECGARLDGCAADAELVALCKRCLAPKCERRLRHAGEVADAVAEYLAGVEQRAHDAEIERAAADARAAEEVNTRREAEARAAAERKRRKTQALLGSLVTLVVLVGGAAAAWQWWRADRALAQVTAEKEKTAAALAKVTEEQARTFAALNAMTDEGIERLFQGQVEVGDEQKAFVQKVIALYDEATKSELDTPESRARRADGHFRVGNLRRQIEDNAGAADSFRAAVTLLTPLCQEFPDDRQHRFRLATSHSFLARSLFELNRLPEAEAEFPKAIEPLTALVAADGSNLDYRFELARAQSNLGLVFMRTQRWPEALVEARAAISHLRTLHARAPDNREYTRVLAKVHADMAQSLRDKPTEMEKVTREANAIVDPLRNRYPADVQIQRIWLHSHVLLGDALARQNKNAEAEAEFRLVRAGRLDLANRYPSVRSYRAEAALVHVALAELLDLLNRPHEAAAEYVEAANLYRPLIAQVPTNRAYRTLCIICLQRLGNYHLALGTAVTYQLAAGHYRAALNLIDEVLVQDGSDREYRLYSIETREGLGRALNHLGQFSDAAAEFRTTLAQLETMLAEVPKNRVLEHIRAQTRFNLGLALRGMGQEADGLAAMRSALAECERLAQDEKDFIARSMLARCYREFAQHQYRQSHFAEALAEFRKEQDVLTRLAADSPTPGNRGALGVVIREAGTCLKQLGRHPESEKEFRAAEPILRQLVIEFPKNATYQWHLASTLMYLAHALISQQRFAEVEKPAAEADRLYAELYKNPINSRVRIGYSQNTAYLAGARAHTGDHASAAQLLGQVVALDPDSVSTYGNAACVLGYCVRAVEGDTALKDQKRKDLINEYTDRALGYLRRGVELLPGAPDDDRQEFDKLRTDKDLDVFRNHPEFKKIMAEFDKLPALAPAPREVKR